MEKQLVTATQLIKIVLDTTKEKNLDNESISKIIDSIDTKVIDIRIPNLNDNGDKILNKEGHYIGDIEIGNADFTLQKIMNFVNKEEIEKEQKEAIMSAFITLNAKIFLENDQKTSQEDTILIEMIEYLSGKLEIKKNEILVESFDTENLSLKFNAKAVKNIRDSCDEKKKWASENAIEALNAEFGVPKEKITIIKNLSEYVAQLSEMIEHDFLSRGKKDCRYKWNSTLYRTKHSNKDDMEATYLQHFKQKGTFYDSSIHSRTEESLKAYGQHFGLPTRYIDFTEAHLLSLFFAVKEYEDHDYNQIPAVVYFVNSRAVNINSTGIDTKLFDYSDENDVGKLKKHITRNYFVKLEDSNDRIHFQKGCFLKVGVNSESSDKDFKYMLENHTRAILINPENKRDILIELFNMGITFESIFPDIDNLVKNIKFQCSKED